MEKGLNKHFITFEGTEGSGKSTHAGLLAEHLEGEGYEVLLTREPGGTKLGKALREMLLHSENLVKKEAELFLFAADRIEHVMEVILPALEKGKIVICDRYTDSTRAYQIGGRRLSREMVEKINHLSSKGLKPGLTLFLDLDPKVGLSRIKEGYDRFESEIMDFHLRLREEYLRILREEPVRFHAIDATLSIREVEKLVRCKVDQYLGGKKIAK